MDVWGLASALSDAVKKSTNDITETFRNTEWKNEFADMRKEIEEDTSELTASAKTLTDEISMRTAKVVQQSGQKEPGRAAQPTLLTETQSKMKEMGRKFYNGTSETYGMLSKAFQTELGISSTKDGSSSSGRGDYKFSRLDLERKALQNSTSTFTEDPEDIQSYEKWKTDVFSLEKESPDALMEQSPALLDMHTRLVPDDVSEEDFWSRYLYKLRIMEDRYTLIAKAAARTGDESGDFEWEDETEPSESTQVPPQVEHEDCEKQEEEKDGTTTKEEEKEEEEKKEEEKSVEEQEEEEEKDRAGEEEEQEKSVEEQQQHDTSSCDDDDVAKTGQGEKQPSSSSLLEEDSWTDMGSTVSAPANGDGNMPTKLDSASTDDIDIIDDEDVANWE